MATRPKQPLKPRNVVMALKIALSSGGKKRKEKALKLANKFLDETDNDLGKALPWKPVPFANTPEQSLAWNLANVDHHDCDSEVKHERRFNLIQAYVSENYREIQDPEPWWQELAMGFLRGVVMALGATVVFGFFFCLLTGQI